MALVQLGGLQTAEAPADPAASPSDTTAPPSEALAESGSAVLLPLLADEGVWQRTVRQQWLLARISELRRQPTAAAAAFKACRQLLDGDSAEPQPAAGSAAPNGQPRQTDGLPSDLVHVSTDAAVEPLAAAPSNAAAPAAGAAAAAAATPHRIWLRGCAVDAVISAEAVDAKLQVCVMP